jgi:hypothetical protein
MKTKARQFVKSELAKRDINYVQLSKLMREKGYQETPDTIRTKIHRGSFSFSFILELCDTLNLELSLSNIDTNLHKLT